MEKEQISLGLEEKKKIENEKDKVFTREDFDKAHEIKDSVGLKLMQRRNVAAYINQTLQKCNGDILLVDPAELNGLLHRIQELQSLNNELIAVNRHGKETGFDYNYAGEKEDLQEDQEYFEKFSIDLLENKKQILDIEKEYLDFKESERKKIQDSDYVNNEDKKLSFQNRDFQNIFIERLDIASQICNGKGKSELVQQIKDLIKKIEIDWQKFKQELVELIDKKIEQENKE